jgi:hypothetical protein
MNNRSLMLAITLLPLHSALSWATDVSVDGDTYYLDYANGRFVANNGTAPIEGKKLAEDENFSQWRFQPKDKQPFEVIYNRQAQTLIDIKTNANDAGGPFFIAAKGKYLLLKYGTGPDPTPFALVDDGGNHLYADHYWSRFPIGYQIGHEAAKGQLYLEYVGSTATDDDTQALHCHDTTGGEPRLLDIRVIDLRSISNIHIHPTNYIACTQ